MLNFGHFWAPLLAIDLPQCQEPWRWGQKGARRNFQKRRTEENKENNTQRKTKTNRNKTTKKDTGLGWRHFHKNMAYARFGFGVQVFRCSGCLGRRDRFWPIRFGPGQLIVPGQFGQCIFGQSIFVCCVVLWLVLLCVVVGLDHPARDTPPRDTPSAEPPKISLFFSLSLGVFSLNLGGSRPSKQQPKFHEKTPREKKTKMGAGDGKQSATFWPPTLWPPTLWPQTPSLPHPSGPNFFWVWAPPFGAMTHTQIQMDWPKMVDQ